MSLYTKAGKVWLEAPSQRNGLEGVAKGSHTVPRRGRGYSPNVKYLQLA